MVRNAELPIIMLAHQGAEFVPEGAVIKVPMTSPSETSDKLAEAVVFISRNRHVRAEIDRVA